jgi:type II secretory pathway pseudopilin PulG
MRRAAFTFVEILIGIIILIIGLVPLMLAYSMATKETRVSISQIQAINHAANLLEALRAFGANDFKKLTHFPRSMEQRKGGDNKWVAYEPAGFDTMVVATAAAGGTPAPALTGTERSEEDPTGVGAQENFAEFEKSFMSTDKPVVAKLEDRFKRSFQLLGKEGYVTIVVRVLWEEDDLAVSTKPQARMVELRTVVADPYLARTTLGPTDGPTGTSATGPSGAGNSNASRPRTNTNGTRGLPPAPRLGLQ